MMKKYIFLCTFLIAIQASAGIFGFLNYTYRWTRSYFYKAPIEKAIVLNDEKLIDSWLGDEEKRQQIVNFVGSYSYNALSFAVYWNEIAIAQKLIDAGIKVNENNSDETKDPLPIAIVFANQKMVEMLVDNGAHITRKDGTPYLHLAIQCGNLGIVRLLLDRGADPNFVLNNGLTLLHYACALGNIYIVQALLDHGADIEAQGPKGTPLSIATFMLDKTLAMFLLEQGANPGNVQVRSQSHKTCLLLATKLNYHGSRTNIPKAQRPRKEELAVKKSPPKLPPPVKLSAVHDKGRALFEQLLDKTFTTELTGKFLNLPSQKDAQLLVKARFIKLTNGPERFTLLFDFVPQTKQLKVQSRALFFEPQTSIDGKVTLFVLQEHKDGSFEKGATSYKGFDRFKKTCGKNSKKQFVKDNNVCVFESTLQVTSENNGMIKIAGNTLFGDHTITVKFYLDVASDDLDLIALKKREKEIITTQQKLAELEIEQTYPIKMQISGHYVGTLKDVHYEAFIPPFENKIFTIPFRITRNNQESSEHSLLVVPETLVGKDEHYAMFTPQSKVGETYKFVAGTTTFDGQFAKNSKVKGSIRPLCFEEPISLRLNNENVVVLSVRTTLDAREQLVLTRIDDEMSPSFQNEELNSLEQEVLLSYEHYDPEYEIPLLNHEILKVTQPPQEQAVTKNVRPNRKTKKQFAKEECFNLGPFSKKAQERDKRQREENLSVVQAFLAREDETKNEINVQPVAQSERHNSPHQLLEHYVPQKTWLNPATLYEDCPLYNEDFDWQQNMWLGQGFVFESGKYRLDNHLRIAVSMKNINGMGKFAPGASWCSFFAASYGEKNRENGLNAHCSYHESENNSEAKRRFLNISGHGTFEIKNTTKDDNYLLYRMAEHNDDDQAPLAYILRRWKPVKKLSRLTALNSAHAFVGFRSNYLTQLNAKADQEELFRIAEQIKRRLLNDIKYMKIVYGKNNPTLLEARFFAQDKCQLVKMLDAVRVELWQHVLNWQIDMINKHTGIISLLVENNGFLESITQKFRINDDGNLEF